MAVRAQMEIMGLAIIVVIIILGLVISLSLMRPGKLTDVSIDSQDSTLASNMLNVMLKTTLDCDLELKNLIQDCAEGVRNKEYCSAAETDPCAKSQEIIGYILNETLGKMKKDYAFEAGTILKIPSDPTCTKASVGKRYTSRLQESYPLPTKRGTITITIYICR
jgi:hypothetical protein